MSEHGHPWIGRTVSHYEILDKIGVGGMGVVYKARDLRLERIAALKFLPASHDGQEARQRFLQEAKAASSLDHSNICTVYEIDETGEGEIFFAMAYCEGETLREKIRRGPLKLGEALEYAIQICQGLARAHAHGVVHRDIKPANLIVSPAGQLKIVDFGIARLVDETRLTRVGHAVGTAAYMSPEQILGEPLDRRTDIWSLGVVLYEMVTGLPPFGGDDRTVGHTILHVDPRPLTVLRPGVPAELERIVAKALAKEPADRYQHVDEIPVDLKALQRSTDRGGSSTGVTRIEIPRSSRAEPARPATVRRWQPPTRKGLFRAAGLVALAGLMFLAGLAVARQRALFSPTVKAPTFKLLTYERGTIQRARFSPDGQTLLFGASWNGAPFRLFLTRPGSLLSSPIDLSPADLFAVSPTGELAIALDHSLANIYNYGIGTLAAAPLLGGGARRLQEGILEADWAPGGSGLALVRAIETGSSRLEFPIGKVLYAVGGDISNLRFSRDGKRIAFFEHPPAWDWSGSLCVTEVESGRTVKLSKGWSTLRGLAWSPSGDEIWVSGSRDWNPTLSAIRLDGRERTLLSLPVEVALVDVAADGRALLIRQDASDMTAAVLAGESRERDLSWLSGSFPVDISEDGKMLLFTHRGQGSGPRSAVYLRDVDGTSSVPLGEGRAQTISPDGKWVASLVYGMPTRLLLLPVGAGQVRSLSIPLEAFAAGWFPDGRRLALTAREPGKPTRCYEFDLAGGTPRALTPEGMVCPVLKTPVSPDGKYVVGWNDRSAALFPVHGGPSRAIPYLGAEWFIRWDATGKALFSFVRTADPKSALLWRIDRVDVTTGKRQLWKDIRPADPSGLAIKRVLLTADGETYAYAGTRTTSRLFLVEGLR